MKKTSVKGKGFWLVFFVNMIFQTEWLFLGLILLALHHWLGLPIIFSYLVFIYWGFTVFIIPYFLKWVHKSSSDSSGGQRISERLKNKEAERKDDENHKL